MKTILFDLDGTLLPMNSEKFEKVYFMTLGKYFEETISKELLIKYIWASTKEMISDKSNLDNKSVFENSFSKYVNNLDFYMNRFTSYYESDFDKVKVSTSIEPLVSKIIKLLKDKGYNLVLATNPLFPLVAVKKRIEWAGLNFDDFIHVTHFEKSTSCKPNLSYYSEILTTLNEKAENCIMIGNDVEEDMVAGKVGMKTFLITPNIIKRNDISKFWDYEGDYNSLYEWANELPVID